MNFSDLFFPRKKHLEHSSQWNPIVSCREKMTVNAKFYIISFHKYIRYIPTLP